MEEEEMRLRTISMALAAAAILILGMAGTGLAMHDGGVAHCDACHTMHNSSGNVAIDNSFGGPAVQFKTGAHLLKGNDASSACLNCHSGSSGPKVLSVTGTTDFSTAPAGDFAWLRIQTIDGGHNVIAADFGLGMDSRPGMATAPGPKTTGYPGNALYCSSCHDPHGRYRFTDANTFSTTGAPIMGSGSSTNVPTATQAVGSYRILAGNGYLPKSAPGAEAFFNDPPVALSPSGTSTTNNWMRRQPYGSGMSEWCANCHNAIHNAGGASALRHPAGNGAKLAGTYSTNYNAYKHTGDLTGSQTTSWTPLVPFETGDILSTRTTNLIPMRDTTDLGHFGGPVTGDENIMCLTCHRAHASGFNSMMRWDSKATFLIETDGSVWKTAPGHTDNVMTLMAYYNQPPTDFGILQRGLCNKCHAKD